jgi:VWFA-related protein
MRFTTILSEADPGPKLLLAMTDGRNNVSWLQGRDVIDAARRTETVIYPVAVGVAPQVVHDMDIHRLSRLLGGDAFALLRLFAADTGGRVITAEWTENLVAVFSSILKEYRQRYLLSFTPEGVGTNDGWHALEVKLRRGLKGRVHARRGYLSTP